MTGKRGALLSNQLCFDYFRSFLHYTYISEEAKELWLSLQYKNYASLTNTVDGRKNGLWQRIVY